MSRSVMAEHTKGPWKCTGGGGVVATMESETLKSGRSVRRRVACAKGLTIEEVEANARLIAAAPALLEALERMIADLREQESTRLCSRMRIEQIVDIERALRLAKGE